MTVPITAPTRARTNNSLVRALIRRPTTVVAAVWVLIVLVLAFFGSDLAPYPPNATDVLRVLQLPNAQHLLGTDALGRDVLSRLMTGTFISLLGAVEALLVFVVLGTVFGLVAGYFGGVADTIISRVVDVIFGIPGVIILLVVLSVFVDNQNVAMFTLGFLSAPSLVRVVRAATLAVREELYIDAAKVFGISPIRIVARHVLPRVSSVILVQIAVYAGLALVVESGLAFLGFGPQPPIASWGGAVADASQVITRQPWLLVPSGGIIAVTVLAFGIIGFAVRDASVDRWSAPRARRRDHAAAAGGAGRTVPTSLLSVRDLSISVPVGGARLTVVQSVSFEIEAGKTVGVVGESGSGKSLTALGVIGSLPSAATIEGGSVFLAGRDISRLDDHELRGIRGRRIGYVSQEPMIALDPNYTIGNQLVEAIRHHRHLDRRSAKARAVELLAMVKLPDPRAAMNSYPHQLSGGMIQRVAIGLALAGDPEILVADEPTTALDVTVQAEVLALLHTLQESTGLAILIVTHDWGVVADLCDHALVMYAGQVVEQGDVDTLYRNPRHPYTVGLLSANPHAAVARASGDAENDLRLDLPTIPGTVPAPADWPTSCHFADRCPLVEQKCRDTKVPLRDLSDSHASRCLRTNLVPTIGRPDE